MSPSHTKATIRMVSASFAAGVSAMVLMGLVAPVVAQTGIGVREAMASEVSPEPLIAPIDVQAIEAQLAEADRTMVAMRATTADEMQRLDQLSGR